MAEQEVAPRSVDAARLVLGIVAIVHVGVVVFSDSYRTLPAVLAAYAAAWWVVRRPTP